MAKHYRFQLSSGLGALNHSEVDYQDIVVFGDGLLSNNVCGTWHSAPLYSVTKASPMRPRRTPSQEENDAVWRASLVADDSSSFSFADSQNQNPTGSAKLLPQLMGVRVSPLYSRHSFLLLFSNLNLCCLLSHQIESWNSTITLPWTM